MGWIGVVLLGRKLDNARPLRGIRSGIEQETFRGLAIAPSSAGFLRVGLDTLGHGGMNNAADVGAIDAHAEGDCGDDDIEAFLLEVFLNALADAGGEAGVVCRGFEFFAFEFVGEGFGVFATDAVDDGGAVFVAFDGFDDLTDEVGALVDAVGEIGAIEDADDGGGIFEGELLGDVFADAGSCGRGESLETDLGDA